MSLRLLKPYSNSVNTQYLCWLSIHTSQMYMEPSLFYWVFTELLGKCHLCFSFCAQVGHKSINRINGKQCIPAPDHFWILKGWKLNHPVLYKKVIPLQNFIHTGSTTGPADSSFSPSSSSVLYSSITPSLKWRILLGFLPSSVFSNETLPGDTTFAAPESSGKPDAIVSNYTLTES